ncbi:hypothetical protein [Streptomyces sp. NPDC052015]|uniref:hypothetical protein n=1 Tax=unclassified Streptomyces TaxID=2593676 RepID=UPI003439F38E
MTSTGKAPAYCVELDKRPAEYLVIANDERPFTTWADMCDESRIDERDVRYVERVADHSEERQAQWDELFNECMDNPPLTLLTYTAVSHGHAAHLARREFAMASAAARMADVIDGHLEHGTRGWIAIRIADGGSDGEVYDDPAAAKAAQKQPERCTYFPISPLCPWSVRQCEEHLQFAADLNSGRLAREFGTR